MPFVAMGFVPQVPTLIGEVSTSVVQVLLFLLGLFLSLLASGAIIYGVRLQHLARSVDIASCFAGAWRRAFPLLVVAVIFGVVMIGCALLMLILVGVPLFFYMLVIWFFAAQVIMFEGRDGIGALDRSRELVRGSWWRVFGIGVVFIILLVALVIGAVIAVFAFGEVNGVLEALAEAATSAVLLPIGVIGATLVYIGSTRQEGSLHARGNGLRDGPVTIPAKEAAERW